MSERAARAFCEGTIDFGEFYRETKARWARVFTQAQRRSHNGVNERAVFDVEDFAQVGLLEANKRAATFDPARGVSAWSYLVRIAVRSAKRAAAKARLGVTRIESGVKYRENYECVPFDDVDRGSDSWPSIIDAFRLDEREMRIVEALMDYGSTTVAARAAHVDIRAVRALRRRMIDSLAMTN